MKRALLACSFVLPAIAAVVANVVLASAARADTPSTSPDTMQCDRVSEPGRVRCTVDASSSRGKSIAWGEVEIISVPDFALPLRGRIGPADVATKEPARWRFALALVSKRTGRGEVTARVRIVECTDDKKCTTRESRVSTELVVGY
jgi:hypothetical protein